MAVDLNERDASGPVIKVQLKMKMQPWMGAAWKLAEKKDIFSSSDNRPKELSDILALATCRSTSSAARNESSAIIVLLLGSSFDVNYVDLWKTCNFHVHNATTLLLSSFDRWLHNFTFSRRLWIFLEIFIFQCRVCVYTKKNNFL